MKSKRIAWAMALMAAIGGFLVDSLRFTVPGTRVSGAAGPAHPASSSVATEISLVPAARPSGSPPPAPEGQPDRQPGLYRVFFNANDFRKLSLDLKNKTDAGAFYYSDEAVVYCAKTRFLIQQHKGDLLQDVNSSTYLTITNVINEMESRCDKFLPSELTFAALHDARTDLKNKDVYLQTITEIMSSDEEKRLTATKRLLNQFDPFLFDRSFISKTNDGNEFYFDGRTFQGSRDVYFLVKSLAACELGMRCEENHFDEDLLTQCIQENICVDNKKSLLDRKLANLIADKKTTQEDVDSMTRAMVKAVQQKDASKFFQPP